MFAAPGPAADFSFGQHRGNENLFDSFATPVGEPFKTPKRSKRRETLAVSVLIR